MTTPECSGRLLVLGLGNVLCSDDGLGVVAVETLRRRYRIPENVEVLDGGTLGLALLSHMEGFDNVILVDAIRDEGEPGSLVRLEGDQVAPAVRERLSVHQVGVADLLDALRLLDSYPKRLLLLGLVPQTISLNLGRSEAVERNIPSLVENVVEEAGRLGYELRRQEADETTPDQQRSRAARALGL